MAMAPHGAGSQGPISINGGIIMKSQLIAASLLLATLATPLAAMADPAGCGKPQGYGTTNPHIPNSSNCGEIRSYSGVVMSHNFTAGTRPRGYGTTNPHPFNAGSSGGARVYSDDVALGSATAKKPQGYGTNNPFIFNSGRTRPGQTN
jgi:hypothetical protein